jgi:hypothetical protein
MKEDRLEQFIAESRDQFDLYDPDDKVWKEVSKTIHKKQHITSWKTILWRAAAVIVIFAASFLFWEYLNSSERLIGRQEKKMQKLDIPELREAEVYYTNMVDNRLRELIPLIQQNPELQNELNNDLRELDSIYAELQKDLIDNIANDEVVEAMIQNYRLKLEILEDLLEHLQETSKNEENEKNEMEI